MKSSIFNFQSSTNRGQAIFFAAIFFLAISLTMTLGIVVPVENGVLATRALARGNQSFFAAEAAAQDVSYRLMNGLSVDAVEVLTLGGASAVATTTTTANGKEITSAGTNDNFVRKSKTTLTSGTGAAFYYGVQVGAGGIVLENSSSILGNIYSNGAVDGSGSNLIKGDVVSAGADGLVDGIHATSSVYAHTIQNSTADKDAYYQVISGSTVIGTSHSGSADQSTTTLPISDAQIAQWESDAAAGGIIASPCPYKITDTATIGSKKIVCDMEISGTGYTLTLTGPLWIQGTLTIKNSPTIKIASSLGGASVALIADNSANRTTGSKIASGNSAVFEGSGTSGSFVLLVSQNRSAEDGGGEEAITFANGTSGAILAYAGHGEILMQNSVKLKEVTAYRIRLKNSAEVKYETGLANLLFTAGPSGGYTLDGWKEVE